MEPWLCVIMPVHLAEPGAGAELLRVALASAAAERPEGVEFRIYCSADADGMARAAANDFAGQLEIVWQDRPDLGNWTYKTNVGVAEARAAHVIMLHHDDCWLPGHLAAVRRAIDRDPQLGLSIAPTAYIGPDGRRLGIWPLPFRPGRVAGRDLGLALLAQNTICITTLILRRDAYLACGGVDPALWYTGDWDLYLKLAAHGEIMVRGEITTAYRLHAGSQTSGGNRDIAGFRRQMELVLDSHLARLAPLPPGTERRARASISANCALAAASGGDWSAMPAALAEIFWLGPTVWRQFFRETRLVARVWPRLRLKLARQA